MWYLQVQQAVRSVLVDVEIAGSGAEPEPVATPAEEEAEAEEEEGVGQDQAVSSFSDVQVDASGDETFDAEIPADIDDDGDTIPSNVGPRRINSKAGVERIQMDFSEKGYGAKREFNYGKIFFGQQNGKDGKQDATEGGFTLGLKFNSNISTEIKATHKQNNTKGFSTRIGVGIIGKVKLFDDLSAYTRVGSGNKKTNTKIFNFWAITPGLKYKINDKWSLKGGVRFRDAFDTDKYRDYTKTYKVGLGYKLTEWRSLSIGFKRKVGDSEYNAIGVGYGVSF